MKFIKLICPQCEQEFERPEKQYKNSLRRHCKMFCSRECRDTANRTRITCQCGQCGEPITKKPSQFNKSQLHFCNRSCAATYNNQHRVKAIKLCITCGQPIYNRNKSEMCQSCFRNGWRIRLLQDIDRSALRGIARTVYYTEKPNQIACEKCGYDKYIEVCHIKPIKSFTPDTPLEEINSVSNLVGLCRNCHWELDHDL